MRAFARALAVFSFAILAACQGAVSGPGGDPVGSPGPAAPTGGNPDTPTPTPTQTPTASPTPSPTPTPTPAQSFQMLASIDSATASLGDTRDVTLTIMPSGGFTGPVTLSAGMPAAFAATFDPPSVNVGSGPASATAHVQIPTSSLGGALTLTFTGSAGALTVSAPVSLTVKPELVIHIARGVVRTNNPQAFGPLPTSVPFVQPGTKITWINDDTIPHEIHSDNALVGFPHEPGPLNPGASYSVTIKQAGSFDYHCHIHNGMMGRLHVGP